DDYLVPVALSTVLKTALSHGADVIRMSADAVDESADSTKGGRLAPTDMHFASRVYRSGVEYLETDFCPPMWLHVHRRGLWERALPYFPRTRLVGVDNLTSFVLAFFAGNVVSSSTVGYVYVEGAGTLTSETSLSNVLRHIEDRARVVELLR